MSRRMWEGHDGMIYRAVVTWAEDGEPEVHSYFGPYLAINQARGELTRQLKREKTPRWYQPGLKIVDFGIEQSSISWERVSEMGEKDATDERRSDKERVEREQEADKERANKDRPKK